MNRPTNSIAVTPDDDVQALLDAAPPGSVFWLAPGDYPALTIRAGVHLIGATPRRQIVEYATSDGVVHREAVREAERGEGR